MTALLHLGNIVANPLKEVHVEMPVLSRVAWSWRLAMFFSKHNGFTRLLDPGFNHALVNRSRRNKGCTHGCLEIVIPTVYDVASICRIERKVDRIGSAGNRIGHVAWTFQNAIVLVAIPQLAWPATPAFPRWVIPVVLVHVHHRRQAELPQIVDTGDALSGFLRAGQRR